MSVIIITPPPTKPTAQQDAQPEGLLLSPYAEARAAIDAAEAEGMVVRIIET